MLQMAITDNALHYSRFGMDFTSSASIVLTLGCLYWIYKRWSETPQKPLPPGPRGLSAILNFINAAKSNTLHLHADRWFKKYGNIVSVKLFKQNIVFLNSSPLIKKCFCDETFKMVTNDRPETFASKFIFKNENIGFSSLGPHHTRLRKLFHGSLKLYGDGVKLFEETIVDELRHVVMEIKSKPEVALDDIISKSLLSVIHILLTDKRAEYDGATVQEMKEYNSAINCLFGPEIDQPLTLMPFLRHLPGPYKTVCDTATSKTQNLVHLLMDPMKAGYIRGKSHGLIQAAIEARNNLDDDSKMNEEHIRYIMMEIISAGYLTTKGILLGIFLILMERPEIQQKLYEHITEQIGDRPPTVEDRPSIPYVDAMVLEAARYLTHGPFSLPHLTKQEIELDGYRIPKDSTVLINFWSLGHDEEIWDHPWEFRPERFLDDQGELLPVEHPTRQRFMPFGIGKRQCPGEVFAKTRLFLFITTLVQQFKFLPPDGGMTSSSDVRTWTPGIIRQPENVQCKVEVRYNCPLLE